MRYFYFLHFTSDEGHVGQMALHIPSGKIYSRTSYKGDAFAPWRRLDVNRRADGTLDEAVHECAVAKTASEAKKLSLPITLTFGGHISGTVSFDGSQNVTCTLSAADIHQRLAALETRIKRVERYLDDRGNW